jgi:hypothetical protein
VCRADVVSTGRIDSKATAEEACSGCTCPSFQGRTAQSWLNATVRELLVCDSLQSSQPPLTR